MFAGFEIIPIFALAIDGNVTCNTGAVVQFG